MARLAVPTLERPWFARDASSCALFSDPAATFGRADLEASAGFDVPPALRSLWLKVEPGRFFTATEYEDQLLAFAQSLGFDPNSILHEPFRARNHDRQL